MKVFIYLMIYLVISFLVVIFLGKFIKTGRGEKDD